MTTPNPLTTTTGNPQAFQNHHHGNKLLLPSSSSVGANSNLASLFLSSEFRNLPIVSPDLPIREDITEKVLPPSAAGDGSTNQTQLSMMVANHIVQSLSDGGFARRQQPHLVPRPVNCGVKSTGKPPPIPLIPSGGRRTSSETHQQQQGETGAGGGKLRLNKFVRRLHDMLQAEKHTGIVEWRRGLLVLNSTDAFAKHILPRHFNTRNFKTFRRQLNYYGFVHVRSFSTTGSSTTALWVNRDLAKTGTDDISSVLQLRRVEPCEEAKTAEGRRHRKEMAIHTVEEDIGVSPKSLQLEQIRSLALRGEHFLCPPPPPQPPLITAPSHITFSPPIPIEVHVPTDLSSNYSNTNPPTPEESLPSEEEEAPGDNASENAANVLLMLARS